MIRVEARANGPQQKAKAMTRKSTASTSIEQEPVVKQIDICGIHDGKSLQSRVKCDKQTIDDYAESYKPKPTVKLPPIDVFYDGNAYFHAPRSQCRFARTANSTALPPPVGGKVRQLFWAFDSRGERR